MNAPAVGDQQRKGVEVGLRELGQLAPALDLGDHRVLTTDRLKHSRVGRVAGLAAPLAREAELAEQDLLQLLRRSKDESFSNHVEDLPLQIVGLGLHPPGDRL